MSGRPALRPFVATYRVQLRKELDFRAAAGLVDYLDALGFSHLYTSPCLAAVPGSTHGYDLVDPGALSPELGGDEGHAALASALAERGLGHMVDFVPNHMSASAHNPWWMDVLEHGPSSQRADVFDIEWAPPKLGLRDKILLPMLGRPYGEALEAGELRPARREGTFVLEASGVELPLGPKTVGPFVTAAVESLALGEDDPVGQELESIATAYGNLPNRTETEPARRRERSRESDVLERRLARVAAEPGVAEALDRAVRALDGRPGEPASFDALDALLQNQSYRLAFWQVASDEINYRRFFDVNDLVAVRMEDPAVFDACHAKLLELVERGVVHAVRLDHVDGLHDPEAYLGALRTALAGRTSRHVPVVVEKILSPGETLPEAWATEGTTGYEFLALAGGVLVDPAGLDALGALYVDVTGDRRSFAEHVRDAKRAVLRASLASEVRMLVLRLERIAEKERRSRDFTGSVLGQAVAETLVAFPVYRTYVRADGARTPEDEAIVRRAIRRARRENPELSPAVFAFLARVMLAEDHETLDDASRAERRELASRFQQLTGPVMAKGVEDTAFYAWVPFAGANEVGAHPTSFARSVEAFHAENAARGARHPEGLLATTTHDTKRAEDVRARLAVLTEMPEAYASWVLAWRRLGAAYETVVDDERAPSAADQLLFFQTAFGACPLDRAARDATGQGAFPARLADALVKSAREAKQRTSWIAPDEGYETAIRAFVAGMMSDTSFRESLFDRVDRTAALAASNGLAQVVLKVASPGVADVYQGSELWDFRLVDPDNRAPVDYELRRAVLQGLEGRSVADLVEGFRDGGVKLHVLRAGLHLRRAMPHTFTHGSYRPLAAPETVVAFARAGEEGEVVAVTTRLPHRATTGSFGFAVGEAWGEARVAVPPGRWRDVLSGARLVVASGADGAPLAEVLGALPVALLVRD